MTKRLSPIANSLSAVGFKVAGDQAQAPEDAVRDSAATRFWKSVGYDVQDVYRLFKDIG